MRVPILRLLLIVLLLVVAARYLSRSHPTPQQHPIGLPEFLVRDLLYADLQTQNAPGRYWRPLTISRVEFETRASTAVPGLVYHWASYRPAWIAPSLPVYSVVGEREGRLFLIANPTTWSILVHGWVPTDEQSATRACSDLLTGLARNGPHGGPVLLENRVAADSVLLPDESDRIWRSVTEPTSVRSPSNGRPRWEVLLWAVQRGPDRQVTRFRCALPGTPTSGAEGAQVDVIDSIPLIQIPLE